MDSPEFIKLLVAHEVRLLAFALSLIPHWADADEVLQEATVLMWKKFEQFEPGMNFLSWGFKIIHLTSKDFRKRQRRSRLQFSDQLADLLSEAAVQAADELALRERILGECLEKLPRANKPNQSNVRLICAVSGRRWLHMPASTGATGLSLATLMSITGRPPPFLIHLLMTRHRS